LAAVICTDLLCVIKNAGQASTGRISYFGASFNLALKKLKLKLRLKLKLNLNLKLWLKPKAKAKNVNIICIFKCRLQLLL